MMPFLLENTGLSSIQISPESGVSSPAIHLRVVVLPQPEGPSSEKNSPVLTSKPTSCTACTWPSPVTKVRVSPSTVNIDDDFPWQPAEQDPYAPVTRVFSSLLGHQRLQCLSDLIALSREHLLGTPFQHFG